MNRLPISDWTIERTVWTSIIAITTAAILIMASLSWKLARDAGDETLRELTEVSAAAAQARLGDSVQKHVREFQQIATSSVIGTALTDSSGGREGYLAPFLEQRTSATGMTFALYDYRGRMLIRTGRDKVGESAMAGEPQGAALPDLAFSVSPDLIELEAPIRFFADKKPIGFLVGSIDPALLTADAGLAASRFYAPSVKFYVTGSFIEKPMHMKIVETPRATLAASVELIPQMSWIDGLLRKLTIYGLIATVSVLVASMLLARVTAKAISAPIAALTEGMQKLRNGEQAAEPSMNMPVEIKALASALFRAFEERSAALQKVQSLAHYDSVTGALSRSYFDHRARNLMQVAMRTKEPATLLYVDLDRFKEINDRHGHDAGDLLLQSVVARARKRLRAVDLIGRRGGDEFVVFLPHMGNPATIQALAADIAELITAPVEIDADTFVQVGVSMGAAVFPDDAERFDTLVTCADKAMYEAKNAGRGRLCFTSGKMVSLGRAETAHPDRRGMTGAA